MRTSARINVLHCHICGTRIQREDGGGWAITQAGQPQPHACCFLEPRIVDQLNEDLMRVYVGESSDVSDRHEICKACIRQWFAETMEPRCNSRAYFVDHEDEDQCCFCGQSIQVVAVTK